MSYLERKMFANGGGVMGPARPIGDFEIRDLTTGEILIDLRNRPNFINTPGFNPYKILSDPTLEKGPAVLSILQEFQKRDAPKMGPFQAEEDIGTNIADLAFGAARIAEPPARGLSRVLGEVTGIQTLKDFGGTQEFDPSFSLTPGFVPFVDLYKPSYESIVPTEADRARANIAILKSADAISEGAEELGENVRPFLEDAGTKVADFLDLGYPFGKPDYGIPVNLATGKPSQRVQNMQKESENIEKEIESLVKDKAPVDVNKTEEETKSDTELKFDGIDTGELLEFEGLEKGEEKKLVESIFESIRPGEDPTKPISPLDPITRKEIEDYEVEPLETKDGEDKTGDGLNKDKDGDAVSRKLKEPGFFGSDRFLNFIRNVGGELVRTGQMGAGLASGAAKAAEERAARELLADQEKRKYEREIELAKAKAEATGADIMKPEKILDLNNNIRRDITDFQGGIAGVGFVDYAIDIIEEAIENDEPVGGAEGFFMKMVDKGFAFVGMPQDFDEMSADSKVAELTKVVKQKNLQAILGESGRTISDRDRQIIETVFGDLGAFENPKTTLGKLKQSRQQLAQSANERYQNILTNSSFLGRQGAEGRNFYQRLLPSLKQILNIDPLANQSAIARARFAGGGLDTGIPEISL